MSNEKIIAHLKQQITYADTIFHQKVDEYIRENKQSSKRAMTAYKLKLDTLKEILKFAESKE